MNPIWLTLHRGVGADQPVLVAFEIGGTMDSLASALALTGAAKRAGADAVKVQIVDPERLVGIDRPIAWTGYDGVPHEDSLLKLLRHRVLDESDWAEVRAAAREARLLFFATVDFPETLELAVKLDAHALKACSGDLNHVEWIKEMARADLPLMLDTGSGTLEEVGRAVEAALAINPRLILHHVPSGYPARLQSVNLRMLTTLKAMYPEIAIGYSDHAPGFTMDVAAVALGAAMVEKTLTVSRSRGWVEDAMSVEVGEEAEAFVRAIRDTETGMGLARKRVTEEEQAGKAIARRSAFAKRDLSAGHCVQWEDVDWRRPAGEIEPPDWPYFNGRELRVNLGAGQRLLRSHFGS